MKCHLYVMFCVKFQLKRFAFFSGPAVKCGKRNIHHRIIVLYSKQTQFTFAAL